MNYKEWKPFYEKITKDLTILVEDDEKAAEILDQLLQKKKNLFPINKLKDLINDREIIVFGAGPSLKASISKNKEKFTNRMKIAADGATTALLENDILPDIVVTDLDGKISDQLNASLEGSLTVIHGHGGNIDKIKKYIPEFKGFLVGTTQTDPKPYTNIYNFGGFTDGDRAVHMADFFHARKIYLIGFDFNDEIGLYSFAENKNKELKKLKLKWCKHLIDRLNKNKNIHYL